MDGELVLRIHPDGWYIKVETQENGLISHKEITQETLVECLRGSLQRPSFQSGLLPAGCISFFAAEGKERKIGILHPERYADISYYGTQYQHFPLPRLVFGFTLVQGLRVQSVSLGVVADERLRPESKVYEYPFSNVSGFHMCIGSNVMPKCESLYTLASLPYHILSIPNNDDHFSSHRNRLGLDHRELLEHMKDKEPGYYYEKILKPNGKTLNSFICEIWGGTTMVKEIAQIQAELAAPFSSTDVEWRVSNMIKDKSRGLAVPYLQSRAIQTRLDAVVGPYHWKSEYKPWHSVTKDNKVIASQLCGIAIYCEERNEWIQKWDAAENTDIEPVKGGISDSFKRAAVLWGIGRYLYTLNGLWVSLEDKRILAAERQRLSAHYENSLGLAAGNVTSFPGGQTPQTLPFDYAVRLVQPRQFQSGDGMVLQLQSYDGKSVEAFLQRTDQNLFEGVCLKHVKLTAHDNNGYKYHIMDAYEVA